jgi:hypothetical protein
MIQHSQLDKHLQLYFRLLVWLVHEYAYGGAMGREVYFPHVKANS